MLSHQDLMTLKSRTPAALLVVILLFLLNVLLRAHNGDAMSVEETANMRQHLSVGHARALRSTEAIAEALQGGHSFIFGYGSLINSASRTKTAKTGTAVPARISGLRRAWQYPQPSRQMTALGAAWTKDHSVTTNGVLVAVKANALTQFDAREVNYKRVEVPHNQLQILPDKDGKVALKIGAHDKVWVYLDMSPHEPTAALPIRESYVDVFLAGCEQFGEVYAHECVVTTHNWHGADGSVHWLDDRGNPTLYHRNFVPVTRQQQVDALLRQVIPKEFQARHPADASTPPGAGAHPHAAHAAASAYAGHAADAGKDIRTDTVRVVVTQK